MRPTTGRPLAVLVVARHAVEDTPVRGLRPRRSALACVHRARRMRGRRRATFHRGGSQVCRGGLSDHPGTFSLGENTIAYSYESASGPARVIVVFDDRRRPVRTFFASAPRGSHQELMDAAAVVKDCVAYGPKALQGRRYEHD